MRLIDVKVLEMQTKEAFKENPVAMGVLLRWLRKQPTVDAVPVSEIKDYLQKRLDEWEALGDRKFEPANMWGYNFIMACFDDLERKDGEG